MYSKLFVLILITVIITKIHGEKLDCKTIDGNKFKGIWFIVLLIDHFI